MRESITHEEFANLFGIEPTLVESVRTTVEPVYDVDGDIERYRPVFKLTVFVVEPQSTSSYKKSLLDGKPIMQVHSIRIVK